MSFSQYFLLPVVALSSFAWAQNPFSSFVPASATYKDSKPVTLESFAKTKLFILKGTIDGKPCNLLLDTGASHTTLHADFVSKNFSDVPLIEMQK